jgi:hypothetical protein
MVVALGMIVVPMKRIPLGERFGTKRPYTSTRNPHALTSTSVLQHSGSSISISIPLSSPQGMVPSVPFSPLGKRPRASQSPLSVAAAGTGSPRTCFVCAMCHGIESFIDDLLQCHDTECTDPCSYYHVKCVHEMDIGADLYCEACTQARDLS